MNNEKLEVLNKKLKKMYAQIDDSIPRTGNFEDEDGVHDSFDEAFLQSVVCWKSHKETDHMENQLEILKQSSDILSGITQTIRINSIRRHKTCTEIWEVCEIEEKSARKLKWH